MSFVLNSWLRSDIQIRENWWLMIRICFREVFACQGGDSVINSIPPRRTHPELLRALAAFFGTNSPDKKDRAAARASYFLYCERYPNMWRLIVQASDTVANLG